VLWTEDFRGGASSPGSTAYRLIEEWDTDRTLYPDAEAVATELHAQGFAWLAYFNTFLVSGTRVYQAATDAGVFIQNGHARNDLFEGPTFVDTGLLDLESEKGREFMKGYMRKALDIGFDGWMADFGEWQPMDAILPSGDVAVAHNQYPLKWQQLNREVLAERTDGRARTFFVRSGFIGTNSLIPAGWAGDQRTDFEADDGLPTVLPLGIGLGLAGVSTFGSDIGGYQTATNPPSTKELFFRWTEIGALSPLMRTHHGTNPADEWRFDKDAETLQHFKRYAKLHIQLYPYLDVLSHEAAATGTPIMRALPFLAPGAPEAWTSDDEYLLGPSVLVAPVVTAGATSRPVFVPAGQWLPLLGGTPVTGGATVTLQAPLGEVPALALAGTVLPLLPARVQTLLPADAPVVTLAQVAQERELWVYLGASGAFTETDGTVTTLTNAATGTPDTFSSNGAALRACADAADDGPCVLVDAGHRTATVRQFHTPLVMQGGGATLATLTVAGTRTRTDAVVHW
jgi:alpha-glucosidase (family GH31 glycosyl hydrolase)